MKGFTLTELLVVVAIVTILGVVAVKSALPSEETIDHLEVYK